MKQNLFAFISGLIFAAGLGLSEMTRPERVQGFLDFFGDWDPTLAFVMGGAVVVYLIFFRLVTRRAAPLVGPRFMLPTRNDLTPRLIAGATMFGVGWGLYGFCPGPALVNTATMTAPVITFIVAMLAGMGLESATQRFIARRARSSAPHG